MTDSTNRSLHEALHRVGITSAPGGGVDGRRRLYTAGGALIGRFSAREAWRLVRDYETPTEATEGPRIS